RRRRRPRRSQTPRRPSARRALVLRQDDRYAVDRAARTCRSKCPSPGPSPRSRRMAFSRKRATRRVARNRLFLRLFSATSLDCRLRAGCGTAPVLSESSYLSGAFHHLGCGSRVQGCVMTTLGGRWLSRIHVYGDRNLVRAAADDEAVDRAHVAVVATPTDRDVLDVRNHVVGRIEVDPAVAPAPDREPRVRCVRANELLLTFRRPRAQIAAHVS